MIKTIIVGLLIFSINMSFSDTLFDNNNIIIKKNETQLKYYLKDNHNASIDNITKVENDLYLVDFKDGEKNLESLLLSINNADFNVLAILKNHDDYEIIKDLGIVSSYKSESKSLSKPNAKTYSSTSNDFFIIQNKESKLDKYYSSYIDEVRIKDVPNYMNTMYEGYGCVPTVAAMYLAYLGLNIDKSFSLDTIYPICHSQNMTLVNDFITFLGDNYFETNPINLGTQWGKISQAYKLYFMFEVGLYITCVEETNIELIFNSISNYALPVHISYNHHSTLAIGYRSVFNGNKNDNFLIVNAVYSDSESEAIISAEVINDIRCAYMIYI